MRGIKICVLVVLLLCSSKLAYANLQAEYETAKIEYISALVSLASYSDRAGMVAREELAEAGWFMQPFNEYFRGIDAKFFVVKSEKLKPGQETYILAVTGTENRRDVKTDLNFSKVFFGGDTPNGFLAEAGRKNLTSKDPMIHRGFEQYTQAAFFTRQKDGATYGEYLADFLRQNSSRKLYMTGHSLGGAVATIGAARLISLGVNPDQIEVITFGAPAVGNAAFAEQYGKPLELRRVVMKDDPVKGLLQSISGGYTQFGDLVTWQERLQIYERSHAVGVYADAGLRRFYDTRQAMLQAGMQVEADLSRQAGSPMVYVAPVLMELDQDLAADTVYMKEAATDSLRRSLDGFSIGEGNRGSLAEEFAKAKAAGCAWLLLADVQAVKTQQTRRDFYVSYHEELYDVASEKFQGSLNFASGTRGFTPLQSILHDVAKVQEDRHKIFEAAQWGSSN